ncbi:MAG: purine/pyrimidine permease [Treponema sp.]|jgi:uracil permease|nr:purine/pyrimidine permease [Treponema sp.]
MENKPVYAVDEKPPFIQSTFYGLQHLLACFGATVLVPILVGINPLYAIFSAGVGTIVYLVITKFKVPNFVGSSFAFIAPGILVLGQYGPGYLAGGAIVSGVFYCLIAALIYAVGPGWIAKVLPPVVIGPVVAIIGLALAGTAIDMASTGVDGAYSIHALAIAGVTLLITILANYSKNQFISSVSIIIGLAGGYIVTFLLGLISPQFKFISFDVIKNAPAVNLPAFIIPHFNVAVVVTFAIVSFATICEHIGHTIVTGDIVGRDYVKDPGLHRTIAGDGVATAVAGVFGSVCNTTYGESLGVLSTTRVYSVFVFVFAGAIAILLSLFGKFGAFLQALPTPALGGVCILLYGSIAVNGLKQLVINKVNFDDKRNLIIASIIFILGVGGSRISFPIGGDFTFELGAIAVAALVGIILNLIIPQTRKADLMGGKE